MIFFVAVSAAVNFLFFIGKDKDLIQSVLDRCDAARILAFDHIDDLFWKVQLFLVYDLTVFDDVDGDIVVDKTKDIKIQHVNRTFYFDDIFLAFRHSNGHAIKIRSIPFSVALFTGLRVFLRRYMHHSFLSSFIIPSPQALNK